MTCFATGRKIGCDRSLPACSNCRRTGRPCAGYALRLHWADKVDGRRKKAIATAMPEARRPLLTALQKYHFLNVSGCDIHMASYDGEGLDYCPSLRPNQVLAQGRPARPLSPYPPLSPGDGGYLSYYEQEIAVMISTRLDNGFRTCLLPMAMASPDLAASGLREAMMAVASFHLAGRYAASWYKERSLHLLARSIAAIRTKKVACTSLQICLATCMMIIFCSRRLKSSMFQRYQLYQLDVR